MSAAESEAFLEAILARTEKMMRVAGKIDITPEGVSFGNFEGIQRYARLLVEAGIVPVRKDKQDNPMESPSQVLARATACIILGRRVGIAAEEAVQSIYVVNGRAQLFGDAPLAVCRQHKDWDETGFEEFYEGTYAEKDFKAVCVTRRATAGGKCVRREFSIADAEKASLWSKQGPWVQYPKRMLMFRARGYCLRDNFSDALKGIGILELEAAEEPKGEDLPPERGRVNLRDDRFPVKNGKATNPQEPEVALTGQPPSSEDTGSVGPTPPTPMPPAPSPSTSLAQTLQNAVDATKEMASVAGGTDVGPEPMDQPKTRRRAADIR